MATREFSVGTVAVLFLILTAILCFLDPPQAEAQADPVGFFETVDSMTAVSQASLLEAIWESLDTGGLQDLPSVYVRFCADPDPDELSSIATEREVYYLCGRVALAESDVDHAERWLGRAQRANTVPLGDRPSSAELLYYLGLVNETQGQYETATRHYTELVAEQSADPRVAAVLPIISTEIDTSPGYRLHAAVEAVANHNYSAADRLLRAVVSEAVGMPVEPHEAAFLTALSGALNDGNETHGEAIYQLGYLWYYWIRAENQNAAPLLRAVAESSHRRRADGGYYLARSYMRAEDYDAARAAWADFAAAHPRDDRVHEATYYLGWLFLDREQFAESLPGLEEYVDDFPRGARTDRARWYLGWAHFRLGNWSTARQHFARLAGRSGYLLGAKGQYWEARCFQEEGRTEDAAAAFRALAERYAFTYYGLMARIALEEPPLPTRAFSIPEWPMDLLLRLEDQSAQLGSLRQLILHASAFRSLRYLDTEHPQSTVDTEHTRVLIRQAAGLAHPDFATMSSRNGSRLRELPTDRTLLDWLRTFPRPFDHRVTEAGAQFNVDPLLVWSHMQIESHYNPRLISYADAMGLLQVIQKTGQRIALALEETYVEGMLMEPGINIRYGTWYLGALLREFNGQVPLAITAYNSGAHAMHRWVEENSDLPFDAFVEEIPYDQSREYLKRVIGIYAHYLYLYGTDEQIGEVIPLLLPGRVDPDVRGEIDY